MIEAQLAQEPPTSPARRVLPRQQVPTRDGVVLCTDLYFPEREGARPTILVHTPYGRQMLFLLLLAQRLTESGFCVALQDSRGRYQSGGTFSMDREETDSLDTLEWLSRQPWCSGRVGLVGISLSSLPNLIASAAEPPAGTEVSALVNIMGSVDAHRSFYRNGALIHHWALPWSTLIGRQRMGRADWAGIDWHRAFLHEPIEEAAAQTGGNEELWRKVVAHPAYEGAWQRFSALGRFAEIRAPVLHLGGWFDLLLDQTLLGYRGMVESHGGDGPLQKLLVGPWDHRTIFTSFAAGRRKTATDSDDSLLSLLEVVAAWFERWVAPCAELSAAAREVERQPDVALFVMRKRTWLGASSFPLAEAEITDWYLDSEGRANSRSGDGRLTPEKPPVVGRDRFVFDPGDPVPTVGGAVWPFDWGDLAPGPADQSRVEERSDVLIFTGAALEAELTIVGPLELELWIASTARDTDFTAKLVDVDPRGTPRVVQDGIVRARFRESIRHEEFLAPNRPHRLVIDLQATAYCFRAGHRLRLEVSSSNFPKFDRNLNTAAPLHSVRGGMVADQTVFHGGTFASRLRLPVVPPERFERLVWEPPASWRPPEG
jgi:hypothetical protein